MVLTILIDILLIAMPIIGVIVGIKRGFIRSVAGPLRGVIAFVIAAALAVTVGNALIKPMVLDSVTNMISEFLYENCGNITAENAAESMPTLIKMAAAMVGVDIDAIAAENGGDMIGAIVRAVADPAVTVICAIVAFVVIYLLAKLLLRFVLAILDFILNRGITGLANKILGAVFCFLVSVVVMWLFTVVFEFAINLPAFDGVQWNPGFVYDFLRRVNPVILLLSF